MSKQIKPMDEIRNSLAQMSGQFKMALPAHIPVEKFLRAAQTAIATTPSLLSLDRTSLFGAIMKSAQCGLYPDGSESVIIPFKGKATFIPMVGGLLKLVRNSGELATITSQIVYSNDEFTYFVDADGEHIVHKPEMFKDRGEPIGVYALAKTKDGDFYIEILTRNEIEKIKQSSPSGNNGPWGGPFYTEMWRKSAIKRLCKRLPKSTDLEQAIEHDNKVVGETIDHAPIDHSNEEIEETVNQIEMPVEATEEKTKKKRIGDLIDEEK